MERSTGLTKEQLLDFARKNAPKFVEVDVKERDDFCELILKWDWKIESSSVIYKYAVVKDKAFLDKISSETKNEVLERIQDLGEKRADEIIESFGLRQKFKEKYRDKNVIYKVRKWYEIGKSMTTNLEAYYHKKAKEVVPSFQQIWEVFVREKVKHDNRKEILEYLHGANERLKQLIFAEDRIADIIASNPSGNDTWFLVNYHIAYFISLVKSLGDNLAWLVKLYCKLTIHEKKTDLAIKGFEDSLRRTNKRLYRCIYDHGDYEEFKRLKIFRDIVLHKHALHVQRVMLGFGGPETVMIPLDPRSGLIIDGRRFMEFKYPKLAEAGDKDSIAEYGMKEVNVWAGPKDQTPWQDPVAFCKKFVDLIGSLYDSVYQRMVLELGRRPVGRVTNYFQKIGVAAIALTDELTINDRIMVEGTTTSFEQSVLSMEIEKEKIGKAKSGQMIGLKVDERVRKGDIVFKLTM